MGYCCTNLEVDLRIPSTTAPNVRMVKFMPVKDFIEIPFYSFFLTIGYDTFSMNLPMMTIRYCPYCGKDLFKTYKNDSYVNEVEGVSF